MIYSLHIDESGDFGQPRSCPVLGGVLLAGPPSRKRDEDMKRALSAEFPGLPWPLHAAEIVLPIAPLGWHVAGRNVKDPALAAVIDRALTALRDTDELRALRARWRREKRVASDGLDVARRCDRKLRHVDSSTWGLLNRAAQERRSRLSERARTAALSADPQAMLILARAAHRPTVPDTAGADPATSCHQKAQARWLSALTATVERAALLLGPRDQLIVFVSRYYGLNDATTLRATKTPEVPNPPHIITRTLSADLPTPGAVIADFLLYPLRGRIQEATRHLSSYPALAASAANVLLPLSGSSARAARPMPTALIDGPSRALLHQRLRGQPRPPLLEQLPEVRTPWDRDQARAWLEAL